MFGYVSVAQLSGDIRARLNLIPADVDLIVGIPRSGMIPAYLIGLFVNRLVTDLDTFLADGAVGHGNTRSVGVALTRPSSARHILLVDDSVASGSAMRASLQRVRASAFRGKVTTCAAIVAPSMRGSVDVAFTILSLPRVFEWNAFHHPCIENACFDLDGVLCADPSPYQDDAGPRYVRFLRSARPLFKPTRRIAHIVSERPERYRELTEQWLAANQISFGKLHLMDTPDAVVRPHPAACGAHKARVYEATNASLFYESDATQAQEIAQRTGSPVLCVGDMSLRLPQGIPLKAAARVAAWHLSYPIGWIKAWLKQRLYAGPLG